ncbi:MAG: S8 family serine peptidase [Proteobacteria bacterium]|nr:S8 family serine peptidase [Pseudomonadota bacterium]
MKKIVLCSVFVMALLMLVSSGAHAGGGKKGLMARVGFDLANLYREYNAYVRQQGSDVGFKPTNPLLPVIGNRVVIDAVAHRQAEAGALKSDLKGLGLQKASASARVVSGQLPIRAIKSMAGLARLKHARPAYAMTNVGDVTSQGDEAMGSDIARTNFGLDGTGVTVGVLSDSFDCLGGAAADVNSGDLPGGIVVLAEDPGCGSGTDEGRAIMQLIHDVAPGASLAFHTAFNGQADFASGIRELANLGVDVIVDDVIYLAEPMFQDGIIAQAIDSVVADGVAYFSSAGNNGRKAYQDPFSPEGFLPPGGFIPLSGAPPFYGGVLHDFGDGKVTQAITIPAGATLIISFQWDDPFYSVCGHPSPIKGCSGADTDMDIYLLDAWGAFILAGGVDANIGGDPVEILGVINTGTSDVLVNLIIVQYEGSDPGLMKYVRFGGGQATDNEGSGTIYGHANAASAEAVGASFYENTPAFENPPLLEPFSSAGPTPILFDTSGNSIIPVERPKPEIVAPDGTNTTFFGADIPEDDDDYPNFFGTSASAPHAAGVAALMREADSSLFPDEIYAYLEETALDMEVEGFDYDSGWGFIQAEPALAAVLSAPGITVTPTSGLVTTENADTATFSVVLNTLPTADVTINVYSSDATEGMVSPTSLTFVRTNGATPQIVTVTGVDDDIPDGDINYTIIIEPAMSNDSDYSGLDAADVAVTNQDNEMPQETVHVGDLDAASRATGNKSWKATVTITVHDANHSPVANATVDGTWRIGGVERAASCTTDARGQGSVTANKIARSEASVTFTVKNITHAILTYDPNDPLENHDPDNDSDGTSITVLQP